MDLKIQAGESLKTDITSTVYPPADGWECIYAFRGKGGAFDFPAAVNAEKYELAMSGTQTATIPAGFYTVSAYVRKNDERHLLESGTAIVEMDYLAADAYDGRSYAEKLLEAVEATIEGRATSDHLSYQIAGRSITKTPITELIAIRGKLRAEVAREAAGKRISAGMGAGNIIKVSL